VQPVHVDHIRAINLPGFVFLISVHFSDFFAIAG
jgi:hypothetical protein